MGQVPVYELPEFRELMATLEMVWPQRSAALRNAGVLVNEGDPPPPPAPSDPPAPTPPPPAATPPWGDDFDPERAWTLVQNLREESKQARTAAAEAAARAKEYEDQNKTEAQKLQERAEAAEKDLAAARRESLVASVALSKGLTEAQAKRLIGDTKEELEADADELLSTFTGNGQEPPAGRPRERLRPGAAPSSRDDDDELDPAKLAAKVRPMY